MIKGSFDKIFMFFMYLQLENCLLLYDMEFPANVAVVLTQLRSIVKFEALKPKYLMLLFWDESRIQQMQGSALETMSSVNSDISSGSYWDNSG